MLPRLVGLLALSSRRPSEYSLANLYLYRKRHAYYLLEGYGGPAIGGTTYDAKRHALPLGELCHDRAMALLDDVDCIFPLDHDEAWALCADGDLKMEFNLADSDYIYAADALRTMTFTKAKRSQALAFEAKARPRFERLTKSGTALARNILDGWLEDVQRGPGATDYVECQEALEELDALELSGFFAIADDQPVGFLLAGAVREGEQIVHFAKGRRSATGVYPWMFSQLAQRSNAVRFNFEQDLGNPGLAQSKRVLGPVEQRHKFRVMRA